MVAQLICSCRHREEDAWSEFSSGDLTLHEAEGVEAASQHQWSSLRDSAGYTNRLLRRIYPRGNDIAAIHVVACFQAGQVMIQKLCSLLPPVFLMLCILAAFCTQNLQLLVLGALSPHRVAVQVASNTFLQQAVPELERPGVRMVYCQTAASNSSQLSDIFNQVYGSPCEEQTQILTFVLSWHLPLCHCLIQLPWMASCRMRSIGRVPWLRMRQHGSVRPCLWTLLLLCTQAHCTIWAGYPTTPQQRPVLWQKAWPDSIDWPFLIRRPWFKVSAHCLTET